MSGQRWNIVCLAHLVRSNYIRKITIFHFLSQEKNLLFSFEMRPLTHINDSSSARKYAHFFANGFHFNWNWCWWFHQFFFFQLCFAFFFFTIDQACSSELILKMLETRKMLKSVVVWCFKKMCVVIVSVCELAGPGFDGNARNADPKRAAINSQCIHTASGGYGTRERTCHQNWLMGNCGESQIGQRYIEKSRQNTKNARLKANNLLCFFFC